MSDNVQRITVTQKFNTQPIYVNPEPDNVKIVGEGGGDMTKEVYDTNNNGIVDNTEALMGHSYDEIKKMIDDAYYQRYATVNYKDTTIHANNSLKRNLVDENTKIEVLGQTIQNLVDDSNIWKTEQTVSTESASNVTLSTCGKEHFTKSALKPSTKYTVFFDYEIKNNTLENYYFQCNQAISGATQTSVFTFDKNDIDNNTKLKTFTTSNAFNGLIQIYFGGRNGSATFKNNGFMILEGDWTNKEISFVPFGLNYPATTEVVGCGKNLFDVSKIPTTWNGTTGIKNNGDGTIYLKNTSGDSAVATKMKLKDLCPWLKDGKKYLLSYENSTYQDTKQFYLSEIRKYWYVGIPLQMTSEHLESFVYMYPSGRPNTEATLSNLQIEEAEVATDYEPYTERRININKPLASIDDNIRDRYYVKDGKKFHEQNIEYYGYDDSWSINAVTIRTNTVNAVLAIPNMVYSKENIGYSMCNIIAKYSYTTGDDEHFYSRTGGYSLYIDKSRLSGTTKGDIKNWLRDNKAQFIAKLETPITTEIETEDIQSFDGQTNITTTNVVKPTLDIDIPSDLNAVVSNLMVENSSLQAENQALSNELENQASSIETQQANLDYISMMTGVDL